MTNNKSPRLLVVDDDLGVIAAYRLVLEERPSSAAGPSSNEFRTLDSELFGANAVKHAGAPWRVHFVDQGEDAITAIEVALCGGDPFAAVFLDIRMPPGLDGYETAKLIRSIDPSIHIVFVSGYSDYDDDELQDICGGPELSTIMPKPVWPNQLRAVAEHIIQTRDDAQPPHRAAG